MIKIDYKKDENSSKETVGILHLELEEKYGLTDKSERFGYVLLKCSHEIEIPINSDIGFSYFRNPLVKKILNEQWKALMIYPSIGEDDVLDTDERNHECICSQEIVSTFYIQNTINQNVLMLGCVCIRKFDNNHELQITKDIIALNKCVKKVQPKHRQCLSCGDYKVSLKNPLSYLCRSCIEKNNPMNNIFVNYNYPEILQEYPENPEQMIEKIKDTLYESYIKTIDMIQIQNKAKEDYLSKNLNTVKIGEITIHDLIHENYYKDERNFLIQNKRPLEANIYFNFLFLAEENNKKYNNLFDEKYQDFVDRVNLFFSPEYKNILILPFNEKKFEEITLIYENRQCSRCKKFVISPNEPHWKVLCLDCYKHSKKSNRSCEDCGSKILENEPFWKVKCVKCWKIKNQPSYLSPAGSKEWVQKTIEKIQKSYHEE